jgi:hypothetical protein
MSTSKPNMNPDSPNMYQRFHVEYALKIEAADGPTEYAAVPASPDLPDRLLICNKQNFQYSTAG